MRAALLLLVLSLSLAAAGCAARYQVNGGAVSTSTGSGTSITSGGGGLQVQSGGSVAAALLAIGILAGMSQYVPPPKTPELAPDRRVTEQDCTKPIADPSANLKCR